MTEQKLASHARIDPNTASLQIDGVEFPYYLAEQTIRTDVRPNTSMHIIYLPLLVESVEILAVDTRRSDE